MVVLILPIGCLPIARPVASSTKLTVSAFAVPAMYEPRLFGEQLIRRACPRVAQSLGNERNRVPLPSREALPCVVAIVGRLGVQSRKLGDNVHLFSGARQLLSL